MKYGFDLDDTLSDTMMLLNQFAKKFDVEELKGDGIFKIEPGECKDYYYFADALNWDKQNIADFFKKYYIDIIKNIVAKPGAKEFLQDLKENGNEIYIITARRERDDNLIEEITKDWLSKNDLLYDYLFINIKNKAEIVNKFKIDIFVDDSYNNCLEVSNETEAQVYLIENVYNEKVETTRIKRIRSINEINV